MKDFSEILGWIVTCGFGIAMLNFILKFINKKCISKLPKEKENIIKVYRIIMKYVIKYHKAIGIITSLAVITHLILMSIFVRISNTGIVAMSLMISVFLLGMYGAFINKNYKGNWLKVHRVLAFLAVIAIGIHII
jgi:cytochrome b561